MLEPFPGRLSRKVHQVPGSGQELDVMDQAKSMRRHPFEEIHAKLGALGAAVMMVAAVTLANTPSHAQMADCSQASSQVAFSECRVEALRSADAELMAVLEDARAFMQRLDADLPESRRGGLAALDAGQRDWRAYRESACVAEGFLLRGGSGEIAEVLLCRERLTLARILDLRALAGLF